MSEPGDETARNLEVLRRVYHAIERRDAATIFAAHHPDVVVHEPPGLPYGGTWRGLDGVRRHAAGFIAAWGQLQRPEDRGLDPRFVASGDTIVALWRLRAWSPVAGAALDEPAVTVHRFAAGLIAESRMYYFRLEAIRAFLGMVDEAR